MLVKDFKILSSKIYPAQAPWDKTVPVRPFTINNNYYNSKGTADPFVEISEPFIIAGVRGVNVTIHPFSYNPQDNQLTIVNHGSFNIDLQNEPATSSLHSSSFNDFLKAVFVNYNETRLSPTNNYLIITAPEYESAMAPFVTQKQGMGYNVLMVNTGTAGTSNTSILAYIQNRYNTMSTRPEFVLFVGDVDKIPGWTGIGSDNPYTDLNYTLLEGNDAFADVFLGRFSVANTTQLANVINKSIYMENNINSLSKKAIFMASNDNYAITEGTHNFVIDSFFAPNGYTYKKLYTHTDTASTANLIYYLNNNQTFAVYSGHGSETSWADGPPLNQSQVNALTNTVYPYVYGFACLTGRFQTSECFGETWIRGEHGGAYYWGSSVNSFWDEDDILERRLFRAMFTDHLIKTSPMFVMAKYYLVQHYGSVTTDVRRYLEMYNCLGDPSIYTATYGPSIGHTALSNTENLNGPYVVNCTITPAGSAIDPSRTRVLWTRGSSFTDSVQMTNTSGNNWTASIPGNGVQNTYKYYIKTADVLNRVVTNPGGAPANFHQFQAAPDIVKPVIVHTTLGNIPKTNWPATVSANVTDNIGIDSVWVRWYINTPSKSIKHFKLINTSGSTFAAAFNSVQAEVNYNDSIFYRIFARDNSTNHNTDSTTLKTFKIVAIANSCVGTGTTAVGYPFYTVYEDSRTQMLYTAAEITAGGGAQGQITKIGFNVASVGSPAMSGFTIKMMNTTATSVTGFVTSGMTTVYSGTYSPAGTGWQFINLITPFSWNGQNLLVEVCYDNTDWDGNSTVMSTTAANMTWHYHVDGSSGCSMTGGSAQATRPNLCMEINLMVGNNNQASELPKTFSLSQNYPNPFNPVTQIKYTVPKTSMVKMIIYDAIGREVITLVNDVKVPGNYSVPFDASNLASGVYFYKMETSDFTDVKKMVVLK
jgi:hypothetical protein